MRQILSEKNGMRAIRAWVGVARRPRRGTRRELSTDQKLILAWNWSCLGLSMVRGRPKLGFGLDGMNRSVPSGVGAKLPPGTPIGPAAQAVDAACPWIARLVESL